MNIRKLEGRDAKDVQKMFYSIIEELYPEDVRDEYKEEYSLSTMEKLSEEKKGLYAVVVENDKIIGFMFGWYSMGVGNIHWMGLIKEERGKGIAPKMIKFMEDEFKKKGCYKIELFVPMERASLIKLYSKNGFTTKKTNENLFGIPIKHMVKELKKPNSNESIKKIKLIGEGGQGIKLLAVVLSNILSELDYNVSLNLEYDAAVRGGNMMADLTFSDYYKIENPLIENADVMIMLTKGSKDVAAKKVICESGLCKQEQIPFSKIAIDKFGSPLVINMIVLGRLMRSIGINVENINLKKQLPPKFMETNIEAIKYGYTHRDALY